MLTLQVLRGLSFQLASSIYDGQTITSKVTSIPAGISTIEWSVSDASLTFEPEVNQPTFTLNGYSSSVPSILVRATVSNIYSESVSITTYPSVSSITLDASGISLGAGYTYTSVPTVVMTTPGSPVPGISWSSSAPTIATVDSSGNITALKNGKAVITASTTDYRTTSAKINITVAPRIGTQSIAITSGTVTLSSPVYAGKLSVAPVLVTLPADAIISSTVWSSSDTAVAYVNPTNGTVVGVSSGTFTLSATVTDSTSGVNTFTSSEITCVIAIDSIILTPASIQSLQIGEVYTGVTASIFPSSATNKTLVWSSSSPSVATAIYSNNALRITGISNGLANIIATSPDTFAVTGSMTVIVGNGLSTATNNVPASLILGSTFAAKVLTAVGTNTNVASYTSVIWLSSDSSIATVTAKGSINAISLGSCTITMIVSGQAGSFTKTSSLTITKPVVSLLASPGSLTMNVGSTRQISTTVFPAGAEYNSITWLSSAPTVATVNSSGMVTAVKSGSASITITALGVTNVVTKVAVLVGVPITGATLTMPSTIYMGTTVKPVITLTPSGAVADLISWNPSLTQLDRAINNGVGEITPAGVFIPSLDPSTNGAIETGAFSVVVGNQFTPSTITVSAPEITVIQPLTGLQMPPVQFVNLRESVKLRPGLVPSNAATSVTFGNLSLSSFITTPVGSYTLQMWFDASQFTDSSGTSIPSWLNKVPKNYTLGYPVDASGNELLDGSGNRLVSPPTISSNKLNNLPVLAFTPSQGLVVSPSFTGGYLRQSFFAVSRQTGGQNRRVFQGSDMDQSIGYSSGKKKSLALQGQSLLDGPDSDTNWDIITFTNDTGNTMTMRWNGTEISYQADTAGSSSFVNKRMNNIGVNYGTSNETSDCEVAEILFYTSALSSDNIQKVEGYLAWKWGLQANLPVSHPFRNSQTFRGVVSSIAPEIDWYADNMDVIDVTDDGTVIPLAVGTSMVTATSVVGKKVSASTLVIVRNTIDTFTLNRISKIAIDYSGKLYMLQRQLNSIYIRDTNTGIANLFFGTGTTVPGYTGDSLPALQASLNFPYDIAADSSGNLYIADAGNNVIRKVSSSNIVTTLYTFDPTVFLLSITVDKKGFVYAACQYQLLYNIVYKIQPVTGVIVSTAAIVQETYYQPCILSMCTDSSGYLYLADGGNSAIYKVDASGNIPRDSSGNIIPLVSSIYSVYSMVVDSSNNLYYTDTSAHVIRKRTTSGTTTVVAGSGVAGYSGNGGSATAAKLNEVQGLALDPNGDLYIADSGNYAVRKLAGQSIRHVIGVPHFQPIVGGDSNSVIVERTTVQAKWNTTNNILTLYDPPTTRILNLIVASYDPANQITVYVSGDTLVANSVIERPPANIDPSSLDLYDSFFKYYLNIQPTAANTGASISHVYSIDPQEGADTTTTDMQYNTDEITITVKVGSNSWPYPSAITGLAAVAIGQYGVQLSWSGGLSVDIDPYVYRINGTVTTASQQSTEGTVKTANFTGLVPAVTYSFQVSRTSVSNTKSQTISFTIPSILQTIGGLQLFFDASLLTQAPGATVTNWPNLAGTAYSLVVPSSPPANTPRFAPTVSVRTLNRKKIVAYTASQAQVISPSYANLYTEYSFFGIAKQSLNTSRGVIFATNDNSNYIGYLDQTYKTISSGGLDFAEKGNFRSNDWAIISVTSSVSGSQFYWNGELIASGGQIVADTLAINMGSNRLSGDSEVAEILMYSSGLDTIKRQVVEGELAWKWGLQTKLPSSHLFYSVRPSIVPPAMSEILAMSNIQLLCDASSVNGTPGQALTTTGYPTSLSLSNLASTTYNLVSPISGSSGSNMAGAVISETGLNGRQVLSFNSGVSMHVSPSMAGLYTNQSFFFIGRAFNTIYTSAGGLAVLVGSVTQYGNGYVLANNSIQYTNSTADPSISISGGTPTTVDTNFALYSVVASPSNISMYINGTRTVNESGLGDIMSVMNLSVNNSPQGGNNTELAEIIFFSSALNNTNREKVEGYLAWKWGLQNVLPSDHKYKGPPSS